MSATTIAPVRHELTIACDVDHAWTTFTARIGAWWPTEQLSLGAGMEKRVIEVRVDEQVGGRVFEVQEDGSEFEWAVIEAWDPPSRLLLAWHPSPERTPTTEVEVRFSDAGGGRTTVVLEHRGWEALGDLGLDARNGYEGGWAMVLGLYVADAEG